MKRPQINCPNCGVKISKSGLGNHLNSKTCLNNQENGIHIKGECPHCGIDTNEMNPKIAANHVRWCKKNPKINDGSYSKKGKLNPMYGKSSWNKGQTKETDIRLKKQGETLKERYESGELVSPKKGIPLTQKMKDKISETQRNNTYQRVNKFSKPYTMIDGNITTLDSSWEREVAKNLDDAGIIWIRPKPLKWYDEAGWVHNYFGDFYIPKWDVYLDPKNDWVKVEQKEKWDYLNKHYDNIFVLGENQLDLNSIMLVIGNYLLKK